jgi:tetratricopeptide (TPR) repeat protein
MTMKRSRILAVAIMTAICALPSIARAQDSQSAVKCNSNVPDDIMSGCTAVIQQGSETPRHLAMAYTNRGSVYANRGDYKRSIDDCDQAIKLWPEDYTAYRNRGVSYASMEKPNFDHAIADFTKAIQLKPDYARAYMDRGYVYRGLGQTDRAQADFDQAARLTASPAPRSP